MSKGILGHAERGQQCSARRAWSAMLGERGIRSGERRPACDRCERADASVAGCVRGSGERRPACDRCERADEASPAACEVRENAGRLVTGVSKLARLTCTHRSQPCARTGVCFPDFYVFRIQDRIPHSGMENTSCQDHLLCSRRCEETRPLHLLGDTTLDRTDPVPTRDRYEIDSVCHQCHEAGIQAESAHCSRT